MPPDQDCQPQENGGRILGESLFSSLATYAASSATLPLENFTSQLLAWLVNYSPTIGMAVGQLFLPDLAALLTRVDATTQRWTPAGIIDVWLAIQFDAGRTVDLLLENKIDAGIGIRESLPRSEPDILTTQVDNYLAYARKLTNTRVALLTRDPERPLEHWAGECWSGAHRWFEVARAIRDASAATAEQKFLQCQTYTFLKEHGMVLEPVSEALRVGTPERPKLQLLLVEVGLRVGKEVDGFEYVEASLDKYGVYVEWKLQNYGIVGLLYSDARADFGVYLKVKDVDDAFLQRLSRFKAGARVQRTSNRYWGNPHVPIELDPGFYSSLDVATQVASIVKCVTPVLRAIQEAAGGAKPKP